MARKPTQRTTVQPRPYTGVLAEPIVVPYERPKYDEQGRLVVSSSSPEASEQMARLPHLAAHYGVKDFNLDPSNPTLVWDLFLIVMGMARAHCPGFQTVYESTMETRSRGLPIKGGAKQEGMSESTAWLTPIQISWIVDATLAANPTWTQDNVIAAFIAKVFPELDDEGQRARAKTFANHAAEGRKRRVAQLSRDAVADPGIESRIPG